ncbi:MAG: metallophosphoesterase family protein [Lentisphaerae bacterium]|jgi:predicted phosphodiesterase|nr:metallophosphoesterase family protein [Lentisphaerota bacterium]MBT5604429.1 metallophosphoesterase family protein [Lentisphaerota bacterium]MBT7058186.1 metallophosphoesterase family protein [Lentisphaerota bacterium]MBT7847430.1 metallophosphoesterase family protein [Lentisphaerota bacterium]
MKRVGLFSDIHANLAALTAIVDCLDEAGCDTLICCGDTVGYGPQPVECVHLLREREIPCVLGNHDHYVTLVMDPRLERLREDVRLTILWSQEQMSMDDLRWIAQLPRKLDFDGFGVVHGAFGPKQWLYLTNEASIAYNFKYQEPPLGFCGHSHVPLMATIVPDMPPTINYLKGSSPIPADAKTMVNVGSVGQPRDYDPRAMCVIYDVEEQTITPKRVPYDIEATQALMRENDLPERSIVRIELGR